MITFPEWLRADREGRGLTQNGYADWLGVSHVTVNKYERSGVEPEKEFLIIVSSRTNTDIGFLSSIAYPRAVHNISGNVMELAQRIERLPKVKREVILALIEGLIFKQANHIHNKSQRIRRKHK